MTNASQVKPIFKDLISRHPEYRITKGRFLCRIPVNHINCGVFVEYMSDKDYLQPRWSITPLFVKRILHDLALGTLNENLTRSSTEERKPWRWSDPTMIADLTEMIEKTVMPKLEFCASVEGYATLPPHPSAIFGEPLEHRMLVHIALGDLDTARTIWRWQTPIYQDRPGWMTLREHALQEQLAAVAEPLFAGDRPALARILHDWEAANVRGSEIERYWEPTPFPLEL